MEINPLETLLPFLPITLLTLVYLGLLVKYTRQSHARAINGIPVGIGGWLYVFVTGMFLGGLSYLFGAIGRIGYADFTGTANAVGPYWAEFKVAYIGTCLIFAAIAFFGAWSLAKGSSPIAVKRAVIAYWLVAPIGSFVTIVALPASFRIGEGNFSVGYVIFNVATAIAWTAYLVKSKRVQITYGFPVVPRVSLVANTPPKVAADFSWAPSKTELIGFRFMLLAWLAATVMALFAPSYYYEGLRSEKFATTYLNFGLECRAKNYPELPSCQKGTEEGELRCNQLIENLCNFKEKQNTSDESLKYAEQQIERSRLLLNLAMTLALGASAAFYGIRWAVTGKLRPLWLLNRP